jgi:hypothetical protein
MARIAVGLCCVVLGGFAFMEIFGLLPAKTFAWIAALVNCAGALLVAYGAWVEREFKRDNARRNSENKRPLAPAERPR